MSFTTHELGFTKFAEKQGPQAYRIALYWVKSKSEAEDIVQEALTNVWKSWNKYHTVQNKKAWFYRILRNVYIDKIRRVKLEISSSPFPDVQDTTDYYHETETRLDIQRLLQFLTIDEQDLLWFRYGLDLTSKEVANLMGLPHGTVKTRLHRALRKLRSHLQNQENQNLSTSKGGILHEER